MNILLPGGTGFIGSKVHGLLRSSGHEVVNLVRCPGRFSREVVLDFQAPLPPLPDDVDVCIHMDVFFPGETLFNESGKDGGE